MCVWCGLVRLRFPHADVFLLLCVSQPNVANVTAFEDQDAFDSAEATDSAVAVDAVPSMEVRDCREYPRDDGLFSVPLSLCLCVHRLTRSSMVLTLVQSITTCIVRSGISSDTFESMSLPCKAPTTGKNSYVALCIVSLPPTSLFSALCVNAAFIVLFLAVGTASSKS